MHDRIRSVLENKGREVQSTVPGVSVFDAVETMNARRIGALVVQDGGRLVGIFTERDILVRVIARGLDPRTVTVSEVMTRELITVGSDTLVSEAMKLMTNHRCRHLPVIDGDQLAGLISIGDLTSWVVRDQQQLIEDLNGYIRAA